MDDSVIDLSAARSSGRVPDDSSGAAPVSSPAEGAAPGRGTRIASWSLAALIGVLMLFPVGAAPKLLGDGFAKDLFSKVAPAEWLADPLRLFTGVVELVVAVLVLVPATRAIGALGALVVMLGAVGAHLFTPLGVFPTLTDASTGESAQTPILGFAVAGVLLSAALGYVERRRLPRRLARPMGG